MERRTRIILIIARPVDREAIRLLLDQFKQLQQHRHSAACPCAAEQPGDEQPTPGGV
jgi:hypothetical protein